MALSRRKRQGRGGVSGLYILCAVLIAVLGFLAGATSTTTLDITTTRQLSEVLALHGEAEEEGSGEGPEGLGFSERLSLTDLKVIIAITLILIVLTVGFEILKESLEESVPEDYEIILEKFFGELTVLGFLSMVTFLISKTGALEKLSEHLFEEQDELLEYVE